MELPTIDCDLVGDDETEIHLTCCRPDVALCGERLYGKEEDEDAPVDCADCVKLDEADARCGAMFCRTRQRIRGER